MKVEVVKITPNLAAKLLEQNTINRSISDRKVDTYAQMMANDNWSLTHQGIAFYDDGTLADGQHRLHGIIRAGVPVNMMVTRGLKRDQAIDIDAHRPRSMIDGIKIGGLSDWIEKKHITMVGIITNPRRLTTQETINYLNSIENSARFAVDCFITNRRHLTSSVIHAAICSAHYHGESKRDLTRFGEIMLTGVVDNPSERVAIYAREAFFRNTKGGAQDKQEKYYKTQRAIKAFCNGEDVKRLNTPQEAIYPMEGTF